MAVAVFVADEVVPAAVVVAVDAAVLADAVAKAAAADDHNVLHQAS